MKITSNAINHEDFAFVELLRTCAKKKDLITGTKLHNDILKKGLLDRSAYVASTLIDMYAKCGVLSKAQQVLHELPVRDIVSWSALITGYAKYGHGHEALQCYEQMQIEGISPNAITFTSILKACASTRDIDKGVQIHHEVVSMGLLEKDLILGTALVDMYAKCGMLTKAQEVLDALPIRDKVAWSAIIAGYSQHGQMDDAFNCFDRMQTEGHSPDVVTFICLLKACGSRRDIDKGKQIHDDIVRKGLLENNVMLANSLIDMYAKCGMLTKARQILDEIPGRNVVSWSALIAGYAQEGQGHEALNCYDLMLSENLSPDVITFLCILKACGSIKAIEKGKKIHDEIVGRGLLENDIAIGNALVDMYTKCGLLSKAQQVLSELPARNEVSWNVLIAGYAEQGQGREAINCFERMQKEGLTPDVVSFTSILKACGCIGCIDLGKQIHQHILNGGLFADNIVIGTALMDMYAKCGSLSKAQQVHDALPFQDVVSWNALIAGYAQEGEVLQSLNCLKRMQIQGIPPDSVTMVCLLDACKHSGLMEEAKTHFENMTRKYGITPSLEHYTCMVDVLGGAGHFDEAMSLIRNMSCSDYPPIWLAVLSACRKWGNVKLGRLAFDRVLKLDDINAVYYTIMAEIYAAAGMLEDAEKVHAMIMER